MAKYWRVCGILFNIRLFILLIKFWTLKSLGAKSWTWLLHWWSAIDDLAAAVPGAFGCWRAAVICHKSLKDETLKRVAVFCQLNRPSPQKFCAPVIRQLSFLGGEPASGSLDGATPISVCGLGSSTWQSIFPRRRRSVVQIHSSPPNTIRGLGYHTQSSPKLSE